MNLADGLVLVLLQQLMEEGGEQLKESAAPEATCVGTYREVAATLFHCLMISTDASKSFSILWKPALHPHTFICLSCIPQEL